MRKQLQISYHDIVSLENLFAAWQEFVRGKRGKKDVQEFGFGLMGNILQLHEELANFTYVHGGYQAFNISDPKPRNIHKAGVRDRVLHHAIYRRLYPFFDKIFIADSFSCRLGKGTHNALDRFASFARKASRNNTKTVWALKCDIKKFFASIDHRILLDILAEYIPDKNILWLLRQVILSFPTRSGIQKVDSRFRGNDSQDKGLPLGNLTSQLFCNVYMNELDRFVKHKLKVKFYIRCADDFVFLSQGKNYLQGLLPLIADFLEQKLKLQLHPNKIVLKTLASGVDFLGWVHFPHYRVLRVATGRRMFKRIGQNPTSDTLQSYLGLLNHGNAFGARQKLLNFYQPPPNTTALAVDEGGTS